jgi:hypothetical protein
MRASFGFFSLDALLLSKGAYGTKTTNNEKSQVFSKFSIDANNSCYIFSENYMLFISYNVSKRVMDFFLEKKTLQTG